MARPHAQLRVPRRLAAKDDGGQLRYEHHAVPFCLDTTRSLRHTRRLTRQMREPAAREAAVGIE